MRHVPHKYTSPAGYKNQIFIIDNFIANPNTLRQKLDTAAWSIQMSESGFRFNSAIPENRDILRSLDEIDRVLPFDVTGLFHKSLFIYETKQDENTTRKRSWIHFDPWSWVGIHYLNTTEECKGGTNFYTHLKSGLNYFTEEQAKKDPKQARDLRISGTKDKDWKCDLKVEMRWNRFILFNPGFIHAPAFYFGKHISDARKYQVFLFN